MQIVLFAETKFSKEIVVMTASQNFKDSASYTLLLYPDSNYIFPDIYFQIYLLSMWNPYYIPTFLAISSPMLLLFVGGFCLFVWVFFSNTHFVLKPNNNSKMRSWISLPSQFHFLLLFLSFFFLKKNSISVFWPPSTMLKMRVSKYLLKFSFSKQQWCTVD